MSVIYFKSTEYASFNFSFSYLLCLLMIILSMLSFVSTDEIKTGKEKGQFVADNALTTDSFVNSVVTLKDKLVSLLLSTFPLGVISPSHHTAMHLVRGLQDTVHVNTYKKLYTPDLTERLSCEH